MAGAPRAAAGALLKMIAHAGFRAGGDLENTTCKDSLVANK